MKKQDLTNTHLHRKSPGKALYAAFVGVTMATMLCQPVFAATVCAASYICNTGVGVRHGH